MNEAIECERHPIPTGSELISQGIGAKYFSKIDLNKGYHQTELSEESRYTSQGLLCTMVYTATKSLFRY